MNRFAQLVRVGNCLMGIVGVLLGALIAEGPGIVDHPYSLALASAIVFSFIAAGNSLNDYMDREVDRRAHPERPIPSGRLAPESALRISVLLFSASIALSLLLDLVSTLIVISAVGVMLLYELCTKRAGISGNLSIAWLTGALFLFGGAVVGSVESTAVIAAMAALATLGREVIKDIQDMEGDYDRRTLPQRIGVRPAGYLGSLAFLLAVGLSGGPYLSGSLGLGYLAVVAVADAIFIYCSIVHFRNPARGQRYAKYGMLIALIAFLLGGLT
ncbi:MAG: UbiA family prenyltransferase [Methanomassiliicoccales archaeon]